MIIISLREFPWSEITVSIVILFLIDLNTWELCLLSGAHQPPPYIKNISAHISQIPSERMNAHFPKINTSSSLKMWPFFNYSNLIIFYNWTCYVDVIKSLMHFLNYSCPNALLLSIDAYSIWALITILHSHLLVRSDQHFKDIIKCFLDREIKCRHIYSWLGVLFVLVLTWQMCLYTAS